MGLNVHYPVIEEKQLIRGSVAINSTQFREQLFPCQPTS